MLAKVIAHGSTREAALARLTRTLARTAVAGPRTNVGFLAMLCASEAFRRGDVDTDFIDRNLSELGAVPTGIDCAAVASGVVQLVSGEAARLRTGSLADDADAATESPWDAIDGFQLSEPRIVAMPISANGEEMVATVSYDAAGFAVSVDNTPAAEDVQVFNGPNEVFVLRRGRQTVVRRREITETTLMSGDADGAVRAPMHGKVQAVLVGPGDEVHRGQRIAVIEAMKMEHALTAPCDGIVGDVAAEAGSQVAEGAIILRIDAAGEAR
jgi:3-methylcrotonyl-CoA carboxylase alpha subunit